MYRGFRTALVLLLVALLGLTALSCGASEVRVRTGLRVLCKYNHVIDDTTRYVSVDGARAKQYSVREETTVCAAHLRAQRLYAQAQQALSKGNKTKAKPLLAQVVGIDPSFQDAAKQYKSLGGKVPAKGSVASSGSSKPSGSSGSGSQQAPAGSYLSRLPTAKEMSSGYTLVSENQDVLSATRLFAARKSSASVRLLTANVMLLGKKTDFVTWYKRTLRAKFATNASSRGGNYFFGTDGRNLANLCWQKGPLVFQVEAEARRGKPSALQTEIWRVSKFM